jgi:hypothetical protein
VLRPSERDDAALFEHVLYLAPACCWGLLLCVNIWARMRIRLSSGHALIAHAFLPSSSEQREIRRDQLPQT